MMLGQIHLHPTLDDTHIETWADHDDVHIALNHTASAVMVRMVFADMHECRRWLADTLNKTTEAIAKSSDIARPVSDASLATASGEAPFYSAAQFALEVEQARADRLASLEAEYADYFKRSDR